MYKCLHLSCYLLFSLSFILLSCFHPLLRLLDGGCNSGEDDDDDDDDDNDDDNDDDEGEIRK